jgi:CspA family cold shock protein
MKGTIKKITDKGFGFITSDEQDKDIFFHNSQLEGVQFDDLHEGDEVNFEVVKTDKGLNAVGVSLA